MDIFSELIKRMSIHSKLNEKKIVTDSVQVNCITQTNLRDYFTELGTILEVDEKAGLFVVIIHSGISNRNPAIVGVCLKNKILYVAAYAKEGIINQRTAEKAIQKIFALIE